MLEPQNGSAKLYMSTRPFGNPFSYSIFKTFKTDIRKIRTAHVHGTTPKKTSSIKTGSKCYLNTIKVYYIPCQNLSEESNNLITY